MTFSPITQALFWLLLGSVIAVVCVYTWLRNMDWKAVHKPPHRNAKSHDDHGGNVHPLKGI